MIAHAAALSSLGTTSNTFVVVLAAPNESSLLALERKLQQEGLPFVAFREPDAPYNGALMSIGINPVPDRRMVRRFVRDFHLLEE